jgi:hypothetical protein
VTSPGIRSVVACTAEGGDGFACIEKQRTGERGNKKGKSFLASLMGSYRG